MVKCETIPLNLIFDYPVYWSEFKVLRDLLQNFYDAVGHGEWTRRFSRQWVDERLLLNADGVGFSYDWLLHIGASGRPATRPNGAWRDCSTYV